MQNTQKNDELSKEDVLDNFLRAFYHMSINSQVYKRLGYRLPKEWLDEIAEQIISKRKLREMLSGK